MHFNPILSIKISSTSQKPKRRSSNYNKVKNFMEGKLLVKVFVVYDTKYGNTKLAAETIVEGMREVEGIETAMSRCFRHLSRKRLRKSSQENGEENQ